MTLHRVGLLRGGDRQSAPNNGRMVQVDILSVTVSNLGAAMWHFFFEKVTFNNIHILKSNKVKVQINGKKSYK